MNVTQNYVPVSQKVLVYTLDRNKKRRPKSVVRVGMREERDRFGSELKQDF